MRKKGNNMMPMEKRGSKRGIMDHITISSQGLTHFVCLIAKGEHKFYG